jgi:predicted small secreted protein
MRSVIIVVLLSLLSACGTIGGTMSGAGRDLQRVGSWIDSK